jgi:TolA-binding protein
VYKKNWLLLAALSFMSVGCFRDDELRKELFTANTRILALENEFQDKHQMNSRQQVSASSRVSQMQDELAKLRGEVDRLQVGIQKGEVPGLDDHEPSIAKQVAAIHEQLKDVDLHKLQERMIALEKAQTEMLSLLEKMDKKKLTKPHNKRAALQNTKGFEHAFHNKQFKDIVDEAPTVLSGKIAHKEAESIRYFYSESLYRLGNMREAAVSFAELLEQDLRAELAPKVRLRMGDCFRNLGDKKTAIAYYKLLVEKFPKATESEEARKHLKKLDTRST